MPIRRVNPAYNVLEKKNNVYFGRVGTGCGAKEVGLHFLVSTPYLSRKGHILFKMFHASTL